MATVSYRALSDKTLARYEQAERDGKLTKRQASALRSHRGLSGAVSMMRAEFAERKAEIAEAKVITAWGTTGNSYAAPEIRRLYLVGICEGRPIRTSAIREKVADRVYRTASGTLYRLDGAPSVDFVKFCTESGIKIDLADPIKFHGPQRDEPAETARAQDLTASSGP